MNKQNGFTLVELAIALMVIGLLIGGVLKGQELIENARMTATARQFNAYHAAVLMFRNTYNALPGDIRHPGTRIPNCTSTLCATGGNGDGYVGYTGYENYNFFPHLTKAGLIQGPEGVETVALGDTYASGSKYALSEGILRIYPETPIGLTRMDGIRVGGPEKYSLFVQYKNAERFAFKFYNKDLVDVEKEDCDPTNTTCTLFIIF